MTVSMPLQYYKLTTTDQGNEEQKNNGTCEMYEETTQNMGITRHSWA